MLVVDRNAFAFSAQYIWLYTLVPVELWTLFALIFLIPLAVLVAIFDPRAAEGRGLWRYAAVAGAVGVTAIVVPLMTGAGVRLAQVGVAGAGVRVLLMAIAAILILTCACIAGAAAAWHEQRASAPAPLRLGSMLAATLLLVGLIPAADFFATERRFLTESAPPVAPPEGAPVNVLIISIDTLRADAVGSYGNKDGLTPNLDRLAREGARFEQAYSSSSWTLPAMASLFTGLDARRHNAGWVSDARDPLARTRLSPELWTLTGSLRERGYETAAIVTNPFLTLRYGFGRGFDTYENFSIAADIFVAFQDTSLVRFATWVMPSLVPGDRSGVVTARAAEWLRRRSSERPFYLWVHYIDPHAPYSPGGDKTRISSFRGDSLLGGTPAGDFVDSTPDIARLRSGEVRPDAEQKRQMRRLYDGEVAEVDAAIGNLLAALDDTGASASTLVVCVSDHGEEFWEHGGVEHGRTVYDEVVHVPLLMRWPGRITAGTTVGSLVRITDIAPTVIEATGGTIPQKLDGFSLRQMLRGGAVPERVAFIENMHFAEERLGLRTPTHKYVRWENGKEEVYDLRRDPGERVDLAGDDAVIAPLRAMSDQFAAASEPNRDSKTVSPTGATREALRALGYTH